MSADVTSEGAEERQLRGLCAHYAMAVDDGDGEAFARAFLPEATLRMFRPGDGSTPSVDLAGAEALRAVPGDVQSRYAATLHFLGQSSFEIGDGEATGTTYCLAHHLEPAPHGGVDHVMHIRYAYTFRRDAAGAWRIAARVGRCHWTETRAVDAIPEAGR
jgi:ketosteroid isomerase-like protein